MGPIGREPLGGRSRLVLPERRQRVVALPHQRAADVAGGLAVADEIQLHVASSVGVWSRQVARPTIAQPATSAAASASSMPMP